MRKPTPCLYPAGLKISHTVHVLEGGFFLAHQKIFIINYISTQLPYIWCTLPSENFIMCNTVAHLRVNSIVCTRSSTTYSRYKNNFMSIDDKLAQLTVQIILLIVAYRP